MKKSPQNPLVTAFKDKDVGNKFLWTNSGQIKAENAAKPHKIRLSDWKSVTKLVTAVALRVCSRDTSVKIKPKQICIKTGVEVSQLLFLCGFRPIGFVNRVSFAGGKKTQAYENSAHDYTINEKVGISIAKKGTILL